MAQSLHEFFDQLSLQTLSHFIVEADAAIFQHEWYCGTKNPNASPERIRDQKTNRFALSGRKVCYLATDCARIDFEIGDSFALKKQENRSIDFSQDLWPRMTGQVVSNERTQHIKGAFRLKRDLKIFDLSSDEKVHELNEFWNGFIEGNEEQRDFIKRMIEEPRPEAYTLSGLFAEEVYKKQFDGILYRPSTVIENILGPCNDPMLVLFEPTKDRTLTEYFTQPN